MNNIIPIFKTHGSIGRSIITYEDETEINELAPVSVISIAKKHNLNKIVIIENNFTSFPELYKNCDKHNIHLIFGLSMVVCNNVKIQDEDSLLSNSKISVLMKNSEGYEDLIRMNDAMNADKNNFYYTPRGDFNIVKNNMTNNLQLIIGPYDSFIHKNLLEFGNCIPNLNGLKPIFTYASMSLPYDDLLIEATLNYAKNNNFETQEVHPIYYYDKASFRAYTTFRCINNRSEFAAPNVDFLCSDEFCWESYENKINK